MRRRMIRKTDYGTIILHWLLVISLAVSVATGLRITADAPDHSWLKALEGALPRDVVWSGHFPAAVALFALAAAYVVYLSRAGLVRRIRPDRARLAGLFSGGRARWAAINIVLYWGLFATLLFQFVTGALLYLGHGGRIVALHRLAMWIVAAFPAAHVAVHWAIGGASQLLRVFRPARLAPPPPPLDPDAFILPGERSAAEAALPPQVRSPDRPATGKTRTRPNKPQRRGTVLQANPLAVAAAIGLATVTFVVSLDQVSRDVLHIPRIPAAQAPRLDGDVSEPVWRSSRPVVVLTQQGVNFDGKGETAVEIRAVHDGVTAYFAFTWDDPTRSLKHLPLIKKADGWRLLHEQYDIEDEDYYYEDKFSVILSNKGGLAGDSTFHMGQRPLEGRPAAFSGRGLHYTTDGGIVDVWHWKAARGGLLGFMDDNYFGPPAEPTKAEIEGVSRYKAGYANDPGKAFYAHNFDQRPPGGYERPLRPKRLPKDWRMARAAMGRADLDPDHSESDGAKWWMAEAESTPWSPERDAQIPAGAVIPGVIISGDYSGDRADIRCAARWAAGRWILEVARRLDTRSAHDIPITSRTYLRVAAFDHSQTRHTRHVRPIRLEVE